MISFHREPTSQICNYICVHMCLPNVPNAYVPGTSLTTFSHFTPLEIARGTWRAECTFFQLTLVHTLLSSFLTIFPKALS